MSLIHAALEKLEQGKKSKKATIQGTQGTFEQDASCLTETLSSEKRENALGGKPWLIYGIGGALLLLFVFGLFYFGVGSLRTRDVEQGSLVEPATFSLPPRARSNFSLTGITRMGTDWTAIVNNQLVRVGDRVSGAKVEAIQEEEVILEFRGQTIRLNLYGEGPVHLTHLEVAS